MQEQDFLKQNKQLLQEPVTTNDLVLRRIAQRKLEANAPSTGMPELDGFIKGFVPGHTVVLTGDTNVGKTTIAANFTETLREQGRKTLYIALEPGVDLIEYLASVRHKKKFEEVTDDELQVIGKGDDLVKIYLGEHIQEVSDLITAVENIKEHFDLIVIDHIGYFIRSESGWVQEQSNVIKQLKFLGEKQRSTIMMIAHLRKPASRKKQEAGTQEMWIPTQDDIAGSASFKQDCHAVLIAIRKTVAPSSNNPGEPAPVDFTDEGWLLVTKSKRGSNGIVPLVFSQRSAVVMSVKQIMAIPEQKVTYEAKKRVTEQQSIGEMLAESQELYDDEF